MPLKISVPRPPALTYAATTVTLITVTAATRKPATITGDADRECVDARMPGGEYAHGQRDRERNGERRQNDRDVLPERDGDLVPVAQEPGHAEGAANEPAATAAAIASTSGPSGRSSSSIGTISRS